MEIKINREISDYKETMFMGLTLRQAVFACLGAGTAVLLYFFVKPKFGLEVASWFCILGAAPFVALGFVKYHGMPAEEAAFALLRHFATPKELRDDPVKQSRMPTKLTRAKRTLMRKLGVPQEVSDFSCKATVCSNGISKTGNMYSKAFLIQDIDYSTLGEEQKSKALEKYIQCLNSLDTNAEYKLSIFSAPLDGNTLDSHLLELNHDQADQFRSAFNSVLKKTVQSTGRQQMKFVVVSLREPSDDLAEKRLQHIRAALTAGLGSLGCKCEDIPMDQVLAGTQKFLEAADFDFAAQWSNDSSGTLEWEIVPTAVIKHSDAIELNGSFFRSFYLQELPTYLHDEMFGLLSESAKNMVISISFSPIAIERSIKILQNTILGIETNIANFQRRQNANQNYSSVVPFELSQQRGEVRELLHDLTARDQKLFRCLVTAVIKASSRDQLDAETEVILSTAQKFMTKLTPLSCQQWDGLETTLPLGGRKIKPLRTLTTECLAAMPPFRIRDMLQPHGVYCGTHAMSGNPLFLDRGTLQNQSGFILGVPGSGKSFFAKMLLAQLMLGTEDHIILCDPEGEYAHLIHAMGNDAQVIQIAAGSNTRLNAMDMADGYGESDSVAVKSQFVLSLLEQIDPSGIGPQEKSIVDRCVSAELKAARNSGICPTLASLRNRLLAQPEPEARRIALSLELYTSGSLSIFGGESTVDLSKRVICFDLHGLGEQLKTAGLLVVTDTILNRVYTNARAGRRTHVFIDEFHVLFGNEHSAEFFNSAWRQFRKRNAWPVAISQNIEYLLDSVQASTMVSNSEFVVLLNQAASDRERISKLLSLAPEQTRYITNADSGSGLIRFGAALIPFANKFPTDNALYELMTTKPGEVLRRKEASLDE